MPINFFVHGRPQQRGSKRAVPLKSGKTVVLDDNRKSRGWLQAIQASAGEAMAGHELIRCAVALTARFQFARPKSHFGSGRNSAQLKASAPQFHTQQPDVDKLLRSVLDGCTGTVWLDDRQVSKAEGWKAWTTGTEGMEVEIRILTRVD